MADKSTLTIDSKLLETVNRSIDGMTRPDVEIIKGGREAAPLSSMMELPAVSCRSSSSRGDGSKSSYDLVKIEG